MVLFSRRERGREMIVPRVYEKPVGISGPVAARHVSRFVLSKARRRAERRPRNRLV